MHLCLLIESLIRNIGGKAGELIRQFYYRRRFKRCGQNLKIDVGVIFENADNISVGDNVWFLPFSIITARPKKLIMKDRLLKKVSNDKFDKEIGEIVIGNEVSIGAYNIVQGYGGLSIQDRVTTSARVSLYSFSHYPVCEEDPSKITYANSMVKSDSISCIESPIVLETGVWVGLSVSVFGGVVGKYSFISANSIVTKSLPENSYASGSPAKRIKERFKIDE